jgi:hypothetical protein
LKEFESNRDLKSSN